MAVRAIEDFTGFPEMMDGRVKTLHPRLYAGLLALRDEDEHLRAAAEHGIEPVDLVCVNLYPFEQTVARGDATRGRGDREHRHRRSDDDPRGRQEQRLRRGRRRPRRLRARCSASCASPTGGCRWPRAERLAAKAFALHRPLRRGDLDLVRRARTARASRRSWRDAYEKVSDLRYGENPHQRAAFYARVGSPTHLLARRAPAARQGAVVQQPARPQLRARAGGGVRRARVRDRQAQQPLRLRRRRQRAGGLRARLRVRPRERLRRRDRAQPPRRRARSPRRSPSSSSRCCSRPASTPDALEVLQAKKNVRLLELARVAGAAAGGRSQAGDRRPARADPRRRHRDARADARDERAPAERAQWRDMLFAWTVCRHVRSNAIVIAAGGATIGIGAGQMSRVDAVRIAVEKAQEFRSPTLLAGVGARLRRVLPVRRRPRSWRSTRASARSSSPAARCATRIVVADAAGVRWSRRRRRRSRH